MKILIRLLLILSLYITELNAFELINLPELEAAVGHTEASSTNGEENSFVDVHLTGVPSSIVNQVNVITGTYHDHHVDLTVPGAHPIKIERSYTSNYTRDHWFDDFRMDIRNTIHMNRAPSTTSHIASSN